MVSPWKEGNTSVSVQFASASAWCWKLTSFKVYLKTQFISFTHKVKEICNWGLNPIVKYPKTIPAATENKSYMFVFIVIKDKTQQVCVVSPIIYHNLKEKLVNRVFFNLQSYEEIQRHWQNRVTDWLSLKTRQNAFIWLILMSSAGSQVDKQKSTSAPPFIFNCAFWVKTVHYVKLRSGSLIVFTFD